MKITPTIALLGLTTSLASATIVAQKDYEASDFGFTDGGASNTFPDANSKIDGVNSLGLFGTGSFANYSTNTTYSTAGQMITVNFKFRADFDVTGASADAHTNILGFALKDGGGSDLLVFKFEEGTNGILLNDGGSDFERGGVTFSASDIYDFSFTTVIGSDKYSYTIGSGSSGSDSGTDFTFSSGAVGSFGDVSFFMNGPGGFGEDGFVDSIRVDVVPEPSSAALLGLGGLSLLLRRRRND